jgi:O-acetyl-ADP-ribose deacetylase (regulator of RNase III)
MVKIISGNLLDSKEDYICHQVNCRGVMGSGVAKAIRDKWPEVYEAYLQHISMCIGTPLGSICYAPIEHSNQEVVNMFAQFSYGYDGLRYTSYDAFCNCLSAMSRDIPKSKTIAFPYKIGSDRGGANWNIIYAMICEILGDWDVTIYKLEG